MFKQTIVGAAMLAALGLAHAGTTQLESTNESISTAQVNGDGPVTNRSPTYVFPAPVQPGMVKSPGCIKSGVTSVSGIFNLFSYSGPVHDQDELCEFVLLHDQLKRNCQFLSAHLLQIDFLKKKYPRLKVADQPPPGVRDLSLEECFSEKTPAPPATAQPVEPSVQPPELPKENNSPKVAEEAQPVPTPSQPPKPVHTRIQFEFGDSTLSAPARAQLDLLLDLVLPLEKSSWVIGVGHASRPGSAVYNQRLSLKRAQTVKDYLVARGVDPSQISIEGRGASEPITQERNTAERDQNQRVEISIFR